jgi:hypothetical protein
MGETPIQIEVRYVPGVGWHWRVFTAHEDWSGVEGSMDQAWASARIRAEKILLTEFA